MSDIENILIPGRHHVLSQFLHDYLVNVLNSDELKDINGESVTLTRHPNLIWAVTSANHSNTRRNPISGSRREQAIETFSEDLPAHSFSYPINDVGQSPKFADFVIKEITVQSRGQFNISPSNTVVSCSTPAVIKMYENLGYRILPAELADRGSGLYSHKRPWDLVLSMVESGSGWRNNPSYTGEVHKASRLMLEKYHLGDQIIEIFNDPLLGDEGDITDTRDYETYRRAFEKGAERKYELIKPFVKNGRVVDIGCATGAIIQLMSRDPELAESDFYGIEASRRLYEICEQRRRDGDFSNENVFFYQRNIMTGVIFPDNSVDTTTTFSLTHEIESYLGRDTLLKFISKIYQQTAIGGLYINSDVIAPDNKDDTVFMKLSADDGHTESWEEIDAAPKLNHDQLENLSTLGRFRRFSRDFRAEENQKIDFKQTDIDGHQYIELRLRDACEFMSKKDYTDSWYSEMHEVFCFWNYQDWQEALTAVGFKLLPQSKTYRNDWLVDNRYKVKVELYKFSDGKLKILDYPVTNVLIVAEKTPH